MKSIKLNGVRVGEVDGTTYYTYRNSSKHFYLKKQGYPISVLVLDYLESIGIKRIVIIETRKYGNVKRYACLIDEYQAEEKFKEMGFDVQKCFPLRKMTKLWKK